jgi:hypothetical protein
MTRTAILDPVEIDDLDKTFFGPCIICGKQMQNRSILIRLGACPRACNHMKRVQIRLNRIRRGVKVP